MEDWWLPIPWFSTLSNVTNIIFPVRCIQKLIAATNISRPWLPRGWDEAELTKPNSSQPSSASYRSHTYNELIMFLYVTLKETEGGKKMLEVLSLSKTEYFVKSNHQSDICPIFNWFSVLISNRNGLKSGDCAMKRFLIPHFCLSYLRWPSGRAGPWLWTNHSAARHQASQSEPGWGRISQSVIRWEDVCVGMGWDKARDLACYCLQTIFNWHEILEIIIQKNWDSVNIISDYIYRAFILYPVVVTSTFLLLF